MNIAKKLLFSLLLCGTVFAAACGEDTGQTAGKGEDCSKTLKCGDNLACVPNKEGDEKGVCKDACTDQNCTEKGKSCIDGPKVEGVTEAPKVCGVKKGGGNQQEGVALTKECTQQNQCVQNGVCVVAAKADTTGKCQIKCNTKTPVSGECTGETSACDEVDGLISTGAGKVMTCVKPEDYNGGQPVAAGEACSEKVKCADGSVCVGADTSAKVGTCVVVCTGSAACTDQAKPACVESKTVIGTYTDKKVCSEPLPLGSTCTATKECDGTDVVCAADLCSKKCADPSECSAPTDQCGDKPETGGSGNVKVCHA